jgi:hypothetical protein
MRRMTGVGGLLRLLAVALMAMVPCGAMAQGAGGIQAGVAGAVIGPHRVVRLEC